MGILEALTADPEAGLALSAGMIRGDLGGGLAAFGQAVAARRQREIEAQDRAMKRMLMDAQIQNYQSEIASRGVAADKTRAGLEILDRVRRRQQGGVPASAADAPPVSAPGGMPSVALAAPAGGGAANNQLLGLTIDDVAALKMAGVADLMDVYKYANDPQQLQPGSTYQNRVTGARETIPQLLPGQQVQGGQVSNMPGYANALAEQEGAKARATEAAKAEADLVTVTLPGGRTVMLPRAQLLREAGGAPASAPAASPRAPLANPSGYNGGSVDAANAESLRYIDEELKRSDLSPMTRAGLLRNRAQLMLQTPMAAGGAALSRGPGLQVQGEAEKIRANKTAEAEVARDTGRQADSKRANEMLSNAQRALELLDKNPTQSTVGNLVDKGAALVGMTPKGAEEAAQLSALSGWMVANVPRMEGPQSNIDVQNYTVMAGRVGDPTLPVAQRKAAAREVIRLQQKYGELNGLQINTGGASGSFGAPRGGVVDFGSLK